MIAITMFIIGISAQSHAVCPGGGTPAQEKLGRLLLKDQYSRISCKYLGAPYEFGKTIGLAAHAGIDYPAAASKAVYAPMSGTLIKSDTFVAGNAVYYDLGNGKKLFILHIKNYKTGWVNKGDKIAEIYQDHAHAELRVDYYGKCLIGGPSCGGYCTSSQIEAMTDDPSSVISSETTKPVAPTGLPASASGTSITLRWTDTSSNESGFRLYRWNGSQWASLVAIAANTTAYNNSGLSSYTTYSYKVCAYNTAGESCSSSVSATTGSSGSVPSSVSVNPSSGSWTSNQNLSVTSTSATTIYYTMANTYDGSTPADPSYPSSSSNNGSLSGASATFELWGKSGYLKRSKLRFIGCNGYGCGPVSGVYSYSIDQRSTVSKPAAPGSVSATATSSSSINLRWSDLSSNESGFRPYRWNGSTWTLLGNLSANTTSYTNSGLSSNTTYYYYLCSYNSAGESCPANYVQATTSSTSSGSSWDGKSPSGTVCEQDATTVASQSNSYGKVELRWSNTCKTNWTRVVPNSSSYSTYGKIRRTSDGRSYTTSGTGTRFTAMVYAPTVQACASGTINGYSLSEVCR